MENNANTSAHSPTLYTLMEKVLDSNLEPEQKKSLIDELRKNNPATSDRWTFRLAIYILGGAFLISIIAIWALSAYGQEVPHGLTALGSSIAGVLAGMLSQSGSRSSEESK